MAIWAARHDTAQHAGLLAVPCRHGELVPAAEEERWGTRRRRPPCGGRGAAAATACDGRERGGHATAERGRELAAAPERELAAAQGLRGGDEDAQLRSVTWEGDGGGTGEGDGDDAGEEEKAAERIDVVRRGARGRAAA